MIITTFIVGHSITQEVTTLLGIIANYHLIDAVIALTFILALLMM